MKMIINNNRGREVQYLDRYWLLTKEKLERSDHDFELAFNRILFIARSQIGLNSASVISNLLLYVSILYKACYQSLSVCQANESFIRKLVAIKGSEAGEVTIERLYHDAFKHQDIQSAVSQEFMLRFSEMMFQYFENTHHLRQFFHDNRLVLLKLIAALKHIAIGYQQGDDTMRRAYLFAKLLCYLRYIVVDQFNFNNKAVINDNVRDDVISIYSIIPNLMAKLDHYDFGVCFQDNRVMHYEIDGRQSHFGKIYPNAVEQDELPCCIHVFTERGNDHVGSFRQRFNRGEFYLIAEKQHYRQKDVDASRVYYAKVGGNNAWQLLQSAMRKCMSFYAKSS